MKCPEQQEEQQLKKLLGPLAVGHRQKIERHYYFERMT